MNDMTYAPEELEQMQAEHKAVQAELLKPGRFPTQAEQAYAIAWATFLYLPETHPLSNPRYAPKPRSFGLTKKSQVVHAEDMVEDAIVTVVGYSQK